MKDLPAEELAKLQINELWSQKLAEQERSVVSNRRWTLFLAVGNGAALTAVSAVLLDKQSEALTALSLPSCWLWALGLITAGLTTPITTQRHSIASEVWSEWLTAFRRGEPLLWNKTRATLDKRLLGLETALEWVAAACFAGGLVYPLAVLSHRYVAGTNGFY